MFTKSVASNASVQRSDYRLFCIALAVLTLVKTVLAWQLPLFGDEAFYWLESRHLAASYSDVPLATPWLIALGTAIGGNSALGVRWPFLLIGSCLPWLVRAWAHRLAPDSGPTAIVDACWLALLLPLSGMLGLFALPDVCLTAVLLGLALALETALRGDRWRDWLLVGLCLALGWLCHFRFVIAYVAGAVFLLATARGRLSLRSPRFWAAQLLGLCGLLPAAIHAVLSDWAAFRFQFVDRHPWAFHADGLRDLLVQAGVVTPLLFVVLLWSVLGLIRTGALRKPPHDLAASLAVGIFAGFLLLGLFADAERSRFHWHLPAYLLALPYAAAQLQRWRAAAGWRRLLAWTVPATAAAGLLALILVIGDGARRDPLREPLFDRPQPDNLWNWPALARWVRQLPVVDGQSALLADNFMLGAELSFELDARPVFVLDHPLNRKHGRAAALAALGLDEAAWRAAAANVGVLIVEENSRRPLLRLAAWRELCARFDSLQWLDEMTLFGGQERYVAFAVRKSGPGDPATPRCTLPALGDFSQPQPGAKLSGASVEMRGWAIEEREGVAQVELLIDGAPRMTAAYGQPFPGVRNQWPLSTDPHHPYVGWVARLPLDDLAAGSHRLALRITTNAGAVSVVAERAVSIAK